MGRNVRLKVPMFFQPLGSNVCGAACARMIAGYHGMRRPLGSIVTAMRCKSGGAFEPRVGMWFLQRGFSVTIIGKGSCLPNRFMDLAPERARKEIIRWAARRSRSPDAARRTIAKDLCAFLCGGGCVVPRPVRLSDIRRALRRSLPLIAAVDISMLTRGDLETDPHYIVITGIDGRRIRCNDPYPEPGGRCEFDADELLYAMARLDGSLIIAGPGR